MGKEFESLVTDDCMMEDGSENSESFFKNKYPQREIKSKTSKQ
jgi:hypothetical protein